MEELVQSPRIQRPNVYFCNFLMVEPGWRASLGRFRLNRWHYFKEPLKNLASRHKCGDTLKKQFSVVLSLLGELFFQNREFATEYFVFRRPCSLLATFRPKKEQRLLLYDRTVAATSPSPHTHPAPPPIIFLGRKFGNSFLERRNFLQIWN